MGLFRKTLSLTTVGLVDFRSDKERIAAYTKDSAKQARRQTRMQRRMMNDQLVTNRALRDEVAGTPELPSVTLAAADRAERGAKSFESWAQRMEANAKARRAAQLERIAERKAARES